MAPKNNKTAPKNAPKPAPKNAPKNAPKAEPKAEPKAVKVPTDVAPEVSLEFAKPVKTVGKPGKRTFIALTPDNTKELGRFTGSTPGVAATKAANKGHTSFILRETGEHNKARKYTGEVKAITPKTIQIAGKPVVISKKATAKFEGVIPLPKKI